jgi:hypothetical protein
LNREPKARHNAARGQGRSMGALRSCSKLIKKKANEKKAKKKENYISKENASNLKRTFENKRRASMHNYASNEENINGIEKHQMKSYQSKVKR